MGWKGRGEDFEGGRTDVEGHLADDVEDDGESAAVFKRDEGRSERDEEHGEEEEAPLLQADAVDVVREQDQKNTAGEAAHVEDHERLHGRVREHGVDAYAGVVAGLPVRGRAHDVERAPGLGEELRGGEADAVEAEVEQQPAQGGGEEGAPVAFVPEVLLDVGAGEGPFGVEGCDGRAGEGPVRGGAGGDADGVGCYDGVVEGAALLGCCRAVDRAAPAVLFEFCTSGGLAEELSCVEFGFDGVVFDVEEVAGRLWDGDSEEEGDYAGNHADANDPSPGDVDRSGQVLFSLASTSC